MIVSRAWRSVLTFVLSGSMVVAVALAAQPAQAQSAAVVIHNFAFGPATMTVPMGTTVTWTNMDSVAHTTTSDTGVWNSGTLSPGMSFHYTFNTSGTFPYHCMIHPNMHGTIVVQGGTTQGGTQPATTGFGRLSAFPNPVVIGRITVIVGRGFTPRSVVAVQWSRPDRTVAAIRVGTSRFGAFAFRLIADPGHGCGLRTMSAVDLASRMTSAPLFIGEIC